MDYLSTDFEKFLAEHYVYDAWQFVVNTNKNIKIAKYCYDVINKLIEQMHIEHIDWKNELINKALEEAIEEGEIPRVVIENNPEYNLDILGINVTCPFLVDKLIKDFFQYIRNSYDSMAQVSNSALLVNEPIDGVNFKTMKSLFSERPYSVNFKSVRTWYNDIAGKEEFKYIGSFNNRTKHACDVSIQLATDFFSDNTISKVDAFSKWNKSIPEKDISMLIKSILDFTTQSFTDFMVIIKDHIRNNIENKGRIHTVECYQQKMKDKPDQSFSVIYLNVENSVDELPNVLNILLLNIIDTGEVRARNCTFPIILVRDKNGAYVGKYKRSSPDVITDNLLRYCKYQKQNCDGMVAFIEEWQNNIGIFYKHNPYFDIHLTSDDEEFRQRIKIPF